MKSFNIIIVGGGLVGYAFALDLAQKRPQLAIAVIETKAPIFTENDILDNRIYAISPDNIAYLSKIGVSIAQLQHGVINTMDVSGDSNSNIILDKNRTKNQFLAKTFEYKILHEALYHQISRLDNVSLIYDRVVAIAIADDMVNITGQNEIYSAKLIVGADGANSFVRKESGLEAQLIDYNQSGIVANFSSEIPHKNVAYQWFKNGDILAYLPLSKNNISIVWSSKSPTRLLEMNEEDFANAVSSFGDHKLGKLKLITKPVAFPLKMYLLAKVYANHVVLIGDAAHTIHPLAGQGVNLGFRDAKFLAAILSRLEVYQLSEIGILAKYNVKRQIAVKEMQLTCHTLQRLFASDDEDIKTIRNHGLNLVNKSSLLKNALMALASSP